MKRKILVTGPPRIGKTTVFRRTVNNLKERGYKVGGIICNEVCEGGKRVGFEIMDLFTERRGWLAHINQPIGPKIGKYTVNLIDLDMIATDAIFDAFKHADILAIDEIGPMELLSIAFKNALLHALESSKPLVGTIHYNLNGSLIEQIKKMEDTEIIDVTYENRANLHTLVADKIMQCLT